MDSAADKEHLAEGYRFLMRCVGVLAFSLPFVVPLGDYLIDGQGIRGSISAYYYGRTGGYFVGSLCAMALFFFSYNHRERPGFRSDKWMSKAATVAALGVALLPTASNGGAATGGAAVVATLHLASAAILFGLLAAFCLYQFTKTAAVTAEVTELRDKLMRVLRPHEREGTDGTGLKNIIYRVCGWIIVLCIALVAVSNAAGLGWLFWLEEVAVLAFGFS